jgi:hypothetical protein
VQRRFAFCSRTCSKFVDFKNFITSLVYGVTFEFITGINGNRNLYTAFLVQICIEIMKYRNFTMIATSLTIHESMRKKVCLLFFLSSPSINDSRAILRTVRRLPSSNSKNLPSSTYGSFNSRLFRRAKNREFHKMSIRSRQRKRPGH